MKSNVKMKALAVAVLGLAGFAFAGASMAVCPTDPAAPAGPWTSKSTLGGTVAISTPGYATPATECKLDTALTAAIGGGSAFVRDNTPADEPRYRAKFYFNVDTLTGLNSVQSVRLFSANTDAPFLSIGETVKISVFGNLAGTTKSLSVTAGCSGQPSNLCSTNVPISGAGVHTVQIDWVKGAAGSLKIWLDNTVEATPTATLNGDTNGWEVDFAVMGLSTASSGFRAAQLNRIVSFDEFDSRRQTFIN